MTPFILFLLQLALGLGTYVGATYDFEETLLISGILSIVLYLVVFYYEMRREPLYFSPLVLFMGMCTLYIGVAGIWAYLCDVWQGGFPRVYQAGFVITFEYRYPVSGLIQLGRCRKPCRP